ncbi:MAG: TLD domain-containing protein [Flavobacteriales bacterium]|nr:TLD domain-containing protein [Flavobacteriales bacterium]
MKKLSLLIALYFVLNAANAGTVTITVNSGGPTQTGCLVCGGGRYTLHQNAPITLSFNDPIPANNIITNISVKVYGLRNCGGGTGTRSIYVGNNLSATTLVNTYTNSTNTCTCNTCSDYTVSRSIPTGLAYNYPGYDYGYTNYLYFKVTGGSSTKSDQVNRAVITFTYAPVLTCTSPTSICRGSSVSIPYTRVANWGFYSGNTFTAQLSNASGSFASPTTIGSVYSTASGTINAVIPSGTPTGTGYRIRVVSDYNSVVGNTNGSNITITAAPVWYLDADNDSHYTSTQNACSSPGTGWTTTLPVGGSGDCAPTDNTRWQNINGYVDADNDGYTLGSLTAVCSGATLPTGYRTNSLGADCNDANALITIATMTWYLDADNDNYYTGVGTTLCSSPGVGWTSTLPSGGSGDCNDANTAINPGAAEVTCNGIDDNCNGMADDLSSPWYLDEDNDGYYLSSVLACSSPGAQYNQTATVLGDCNDNNPNLFLSCGGLLLPGSILADATDETTLSGWLPGNGCGTLLYRKSQHGGNSQTFRNLCANQGPTVVLIKTTTGRVFGAYRSTSYLLNVSNYSQATGSFLISFTDDTRSTSMAYPQYAVYDDYNYGPTFGGGHDLYVNNTLSSGYCYGHSYTCIVGSQGSATCNNYLAGTQNFTIADMEVYGISDGATALCQNATVQLDPTGNISIAPSLIDAGSSDACGPVSLSLDISSFDCSNVGDVTPSIAIPPTYIGTATQETQSHGGGFNPITNEFWYPQWSGPTVYKYNALTHASTGSFNSGQTQIMQLWMDGSSTDYYTANWGLNTITRRSGSNTVWTYNLGTTASAVTTSGSYVYAVGNNSNLIRVLNKATGALVQTLTMPSSISSYGALVYANGNLYVGQNSTIQVYNATTGAFISSTPTAVNIYNMAFDGETMWVSANSNTIYGYQISNGNAYDGMSLGTPVTLTVTSVNSNTSTCQARVIVTPQIAPGISCPADITVNNIFGTCGAVVTYTAPVGTSDCVPAPTALIAGLASGSTFPVGATTVTYQATAANAQTASCSFTVTVVDYQPPTWYLDADNDGYYVSSTTGCASPGAGYNQTATTLGDCNDADAAQYPGAACNDGSACTSGDALNASCNCVGTPVVCDDGDPNTIDSCDPLLGCINTSNTANGTWTGNTDSQWNNTGNWSNATVPSSGDDVIIPTGRPNYPVLEVDPEVGDLDMANGATFTIPANQTLTVNGVLTNNGTMTVENDGSLVQTNTSTLGAGTGTFHVLRNGRTGSQYNFWSSPISNQGSVPGNPSYAYNSAASTQWTGDDASDPGWGAGYNGAMTPGTGYAGRGGGVTTFSGTVNNGTVNFTLLYPTPYVDPAIALEADPVGTPFNLAGNPYPSAIRAAQLVTDNINDIEGTIYFWNDDNSAGSDYDRFDFAYWNHTGGLNGSGNPSTGGGANTNPTGYIGTAQGFYVKAKPGHDGLLTFNNGQREAINNDQFFRTNGEDSRLWLRLQNDSLFNQILIGVLEDATTDEDPLYDAVKMRNNSSISLSALANDLNHAIIAFPPPAISSTIPLRVNVAEAGSYSFVPHAMEGFGSVAVYLNDVALNTNVLLQEGVSVPVQLMAGQYENRFYLNFVANTVTGIGSDNENDLSAYAANGFLHVGCTSCETNATIELLDMSGRLILAASDARFTNGTTLISLNGISTGVYVVRITTENQVLSQKIINQ